MMKRMRRHWDALGKKDPLWAVLAHDDKRGNRWDIEEFFATGEREIEEVMAHVESLGLQPKRGMALDFGCGVGRLTQALAARFDGVWGVDIAPSMIELAQRFNRYPDTCRYVVIDDPGLRFFANDTFPFVYSNITLQHIEPRQQRLSLEGLTRVLAPAGVLVFQLPSERTRPSDAWGRLRLRARSSTPAPLLRGYRRVRWGTRSFMEMWGMRREEVTQLLRAKGVTLVDVRADRFAGEGWLGFRYTATK